MFTLMTVPEYSQCTTSFYIIPTNCLHFESQNMKLYSHEILAFCEFWLTWVQTSNVYCRNMRQFVCSASDRRPPLAATTHNLPVTTVQRWVAVSLCSALAEPDCIWWVMLPRTKRGRGVGAVGAVGVLVCGWAAPLRDRVAQFVVSMGETVNNKGRD